MLVQCDNAAVVSIFNHGSSKNPEGDGIKKELASLSYVSVDDVIDHIIKRGQGAIMAKMDIRQAYRNIPVYSADRLLLGMCWEGNCIRGRNPPLWAQVSPPAFLSHS